MNQSQGTKLYGWYSPQQKKISEISRGKPTEILWSTPDGGIIEVTIVNNCNWDSGTTFKDISFVGEVKGFYS